MQIPQRPFDLPEDAIGCTVECQFRNKGFPGVQRRVNEDPMQLVNYMASKSCGMDVAEPVQATLI